MNIGLPSETIFHSIESTIKEYRKFAQKNISDQIEGITIDQGLVLLYLNKFPEMSQTEIAELVFKDNASMTRMIDTMVKKDYLNRSLNEEDRRRFTLTITEKGNHILKTLPPIILQNRITSLEGVTNAEIHQLKTILNKIKANCRQTVAL